MFSNLAWRYDIESRWLYILGVTDHCVKYQNLTFYFGHILAMTVQCYLGSMSWHPLVMDNWIWQVAKELVRKRCILLTVILLYPPDHTFSLWTTQSLFKGNTLPQGQFSSGVDNQKDSVKRNDPYARSHSHNEFAELQSYVLIANKVICRIMYRTLQIIVWFGICLDRYCGTCWNVLAVAEHNKAFNPHSNLDLRLNDV